MDKPQIYADAHYMDQLTWLAVYNAEALAQIAPLLDHNDAAPLKGLEPSPVARARWVVFGRALDYFRKHGKALGKLVRADVLSYGEKELGNSPRQLEELKNYLDGLQKLKPAPSEVILEKIADYKRERKYHRITEDLSDKLDSGKMTADDFVAAAQRAVDLGKRSEHMEPTSVAQSLAKNLEPVEFHINPILALGLCILVAKSKIGKTWLALQLAIATVIGGRFLGETVKRPGPACYVALEDSERRIIQRMKLLEPKVMKEEEAALADLHLLYGWPGFDQLDRLATQHKYRLIIVDPFMAVPLAHTGNRDLVRGDYASLQPFRQLAEAHGATVVLVHHLRKNPGELRDTIIGTGGVTAAVDCIWSLTRAAERGKAKLEITGRDIEEEILQLEFGLGWEKVAAGVEAEVSNAPLQAAILTYLRRAGPLQPKDIARALNKPAANVRVALQAMRESGRVAKGSGGYDFPVNRLDEDL